MTVTTLPTALTGHLATVPTAVEQTAGPRDLTAEQITTLLAPINPSRVQTLNRQSHVEAWDVRRWLNRVFGFAGWSTETLELVCVSEREISKGRWTVIYRAQARLTVKTPDGRALSLWEDAAMGDSRNQPSLGDAHDMAMKTALSQALKRCAVNLGDGFGLSLYNDGSRRPVVQWSAVHTAPKDPEAAAAEDEPVKPEPVPEPTGEEPSAGPAQQPRRSERAEPGPWETPPPAPDMTVADPEASLSPQAQSFLADAQAAPSPDAFAAVRARAKQAGATEPFLARLDRIAHAKHAAAGASTASTEAPPTDPAKAADEAENALRLAASRANLPTLDADFERVYGLPIAQAHAQQLDAFRVMIENGGAK
ncbi:Rad52/Rad22 family DNA repair protein [Streptomyces sp. OfavH-34-F]|uniref:Rad52/Rad22 family DNA repair protein n=1 Tax=Streptomyces sp. OfavH-34-F TaxID=2917760 RepID=UPI001EF16548|nr:Rad52/Rad22 family DNA repair protein [Streptomyces sp. OfavH-34-F]MCG7524910.1 Rad52/Rad22 family DNA repair protein [Streptomyces sp. OfavH-34-F]